MLGESFPGYYKGYSYTDSTWGDLLTEYDDCPSQYDGIGNPTYDDIRHYAWKQGRQLAAVEDASDIYEMTYDANGMRTGQRIYDEDTNEVYREYSYVYNGSQLTQMTVDGNTLYFAYDASGVPLAVTYNGTTYYYVTNLQGDVIAILDSAGTTVVTYTYDAWGNHLTSRSGTSSMASTLGRHNPLRYRGYVCDVDTNLYYLQSRYYDPYTGRFMNADAYASTGQGIIGNNMFAYCGNNPANRSDFTGHFFLNDLVEFVRTAIDQIVTAQNELASAYETCINLGQLELLLYLFGGSVIYGLVQSTGQTLQKIEY